MVPKMPNSPVAVHPPQWQSKWPDAEDGGGSAGLLGASSGQSLSGLYQGLVSRSLLREGVRLACCGLVSLESTEHTRCGSVESRIYDGGAVGNRGNAKGHTSGSFGGRGTRECGVWRPAVCVLYVERLAGRCCGLRWSYLSHVHRVCSTFKNKDPGRCRGRGITWISYGFRVCSTLVRACTSNPSKTLILPRPVTLPHILV